MILGHRVQVLRVVRIAGSKVEEAMAQIRAALDAHQTAQLAARVQRREGAGPPTARARAAFIDVPMFPISALASGVGTVDTWVL